MIWIREDYVTKQENEKSMYVVTKNNPHYPDVEYFETLEEANAQRDKWLAEMASEGGRYECRVTVAKEIETRTVMSHY